MPPPPPSLTPRTLPQHRHDRALERHGRQCKHKNHDEYTKIEPGFASERKEQEHPPSQGPVVVRSAATRRLPLPIRGAGRRRRRSGGARERGTRIRVPLDARTVADRVECLGVDGMVVVGLFVVGTRRAVAHL